MANGHDTLTITLPFHQGVLNKRTFRKGIRILLDYVDPRLTEPELRKLMQNAIQLRDIREESNEWDDVEELVYSE